MNLFLQCNLILLAFYVVYFICNRYFSLASSPMSLKSFFISLIISLSFPFVANLFPKSVDWEPVIKKMEVQNLASSSVKVSELSKLKFGPLLEPVQNRIHFPSLEEIALIFILLFSALVSFVRMYQSLSCIAKLEKESFAFKKLGRVSIFISTQIQSPISYGFFRKKILMPLTMHTNQEERKLAYLHESGHMRSFDLELSYLIELAGIVFSLNPAYYFFRKEFSCFQEMCCDQYVLSRLSSKKQKLDYAELLIRTAEAHNIGLAGAMAMSLRSQLFRRINMITSKKKQRGRPFKLITVLALSLACVWQTAYAARNTYQLQKLTKDQLQQLVDQMKSDIPLEVNSSVLKWVNHYLSDEAGKAALTAAKARYFKIKKPLLNELDKNAMPQDLVGVVLMESGFKNQSLSSQKAAGLWQFIPATAKKFGLVVSEANDERYSLKKATKAAGDYYNNLLNIPEFNRNWHFALIAYNSGERKLLNSLKSNSDRDPFSHQVGDKEYLAKVMAGMILMKLPNTYSFVNPLEKFRKTSSFGYRKTKFRDKHFHQGVDMAAPLGTKIKSPLPATVSVVTENYNQSEAYGKVIVLNHGNGLVTKYFHLKDFFVKQGQKVEAGQFIGSVGNTGRSTGPHLHYEVLLNGERLDPEYFL